MSGHEIVQCIKTDTNIILSLIIIVEFISYINKQVVLNSQFLNVIKF